MEMILIIYTIPIITLLYIIINLYRKYSLLLLEVEKAKDIEDKCIVTIRDITSITNTTLAILNRVDRRGTFEADDDVGFTFKAIRQIIEDLDTLNISLVKIEGKEDDDSNEGKNNS